VHRDLHQESPKAGPAAGLAAPVASAARNERAYLAGLALLTGCSWGRWLATGSLKVDESYPASAAGTLLFVALLVGWALLLWGFHGLLTDACDERRAAALPVLRVRRVAFLGLAVASLMLPMLSNDVFQLFSWSSLAAHGKDVFTTAAAFPQSEWRGYVAARWTETLCHYGPLSLVSAMPSALAHGNPWVALAILRACWLGPLVAVMLLSFRLVPSSAAFHTMLWLNPLWLLEGPGQLHCDLVGLTLVSAGVVLALRGRTIAAVFLYALAVLSKYIFILVGPWFLLFDRGSVRRRAVRALAMAAAIGACGAALYAPFWMGTHTLTAPIEDIAAEKPGGTLVEVVGDLVLVARGVSPAPAAASGMRGAPDDRASMGNAWFVVAAVKLLLKVVTLVVGARLLTIMLRRNRPEVTALGTGALVIVVVTLGAPKFEPWYLLPALPFFGLSCTSVWRRWLTVAVALGVLPTFANVLPTTSSIVPVWGVLSTGATVAWFFAMFRARFLVSLEPTSAASSTPAGV
jgi:hypothetical protein